MTAAEPSRVKLAVLADLDAGMSYEVAALRHGVSPKTARAWFAQTGRTKPPASNARQLDDVTRGSIERMLRAGQSAHAISLRLHITKARVRMVEAEVRRRESKSSVAPSTDVSGQAE